MKEQEEKTLMPLYAKIPRELKELIDSEKKNKGTALNFIVEKALLMYFEANGNGK